MIIVSFGVDFDQFQDLFLIADESHNPSLIIVNIRF